jgi:hypothetical protein
MKLEADDGRGGKARRGEVKRDIERGGKVRRGNVG